MKKLLILILFSLCCVFMISCGNTDNSYRTLDIHNNFPNELNYYTLDNVLNYKNYFPEEYTGKQEEHYTIKVSALHKYIFKNSNQHKHTRYIENGYLYHIYENTEDNVKVYTKIATDVKVDDYYPSEILLTDIQHELNVEKAKQIVELYTAMIDYGERLSFIDKRTVEFKDNLIYAHIEFSNNEPLRIKSEFTLSKNLVIEDHSTFRDLLETYNKWTYNQIFDIEKINLEEYTFVENDLWDFKALNFYPIIKK